MHDCPRPTGPARLAHRHGLLPTMLAIGFVLCGTIMGGEADEPSPEAKAAVQRFQQGVSVFIENRGQWGAAEIRFALDSQGANVGLTDEGPRFQLFRRELAVGPVPEAEHPERRPGPRDATVRSEPPTVTRMHPFGVLFPGAKQVVPVGERKSERLFNYRRGEPSTWREGVTSWETVIYRGLYQGIDLRLAGRRAAIKYEFIVAPGADWRVIHLHYDGVQKLELAPVRWPEATGQGMRVG